VHVCFHRNNVLMDLRDQSTRVTTPNVFGDIGEFATTEDVLPTDDVMEPDEASITPSTNVVNRQLEADELPSLPFLIKTGSANLALKNKDLLNMIEVHKVACRMFAEYCKTAPKTSDAAQLPTSLSQNSGSFSQKSMSASNLQSVSSETSGGPYYCGMQQNTAQHKNVLNDRQIFYCPYCSLKHEDMLVVREHINEMHKNWDAKLIRTIKKEKNALKPIAVNAKDGLHDKEKRRASVKKLLPSLQLEPVDKLLSGLIFHCPYCRTCADDLTSMQEHINRSHMDLVHAVVNEVIVTGEAAVSNGDGSTDYNDNNIDDKSHVPLFLADSNQMPAYPLTLVPNNFSSASMVQALSRPGHRAGGKGNVIEIAPWKRNLSRSEVSFNAKSIAAGKQGKQRTIGYPRALILERTLTAKCTSADSFIPTTKSYTADHKLIPDAQLNPIVRLVPLKQTNWPSVTHPNYNTADLTTADVPRVEKKPGRRRKQLLNVKSTSFESPLLNNSPPRFTISATQSLPNEGRRARKTRLPKRFDTDVVEMETSAASRGIINNSRNPLKSERVSNSKLKCASSSNAIRRSVGGRRREMPRQTTTSGRKLTLTEPAYRQGGRPRMHRPNSNHFILEPSENNDQGDHEKRLKNKESCLYSRVTGVDRSTNHMRCTRKKYTRPKLLQQTQTIMIVDDNGIYEDQL
jgi:hypothetical protein